jgi:DNA helicase-2/ATP-dependent DNA helicase PcrA
MSLPSQKTKVFGPPGSGKTTFLLNVVDIELQSGTHPTQIGYFAFTRKAATEARDRAIEKFPDLNGLHDFPWFKTLHSLAYHCLAVTRKDMMQTSNFREFSRETGLDIKVSEGGEDFIVNADNPILNEINIARIRGQDLHTHYNNSKIAIEWYHFEYVERAYREYKQRNGLMDFTDLLERLLEQPNRLPSLDVLIIDEAQDLSRLQWRIVSELAKRSSRLFIAGDDDQALYAWAGADVDAFLNHGGEVIVLDQSYRVPAKIHALANAIVNRIKHRQPKTWNPRQEQGDVQFYISYEHVDLSKGEWLVLAAANYMLNGVHAWLVSQGLLFERYGTRSVTDGILQAVTSWESLRRDGVISYDQVHNLYKYLGHNVNKATKHLSVMPEDGMYNMDTLKQQYGLLTDDIWHRALVKIGADKRDYIIAMLRRGIRIGQKPPIRLSTIHGAKGGEADNVLLLTDLSSKFSHEYAHNPDNINRILYVGVTRARQGLHIVQPQHTHRSFRL